MKNQNKKTEKPWAYVVFTDSFLSGWGCAPRRSFYALPVSSPEEAEIVLANGRARSDMKRGRVNNSLPRLRVGDHLSVGDKTKSARWYVAGAFAVRA